MKRHTILPTLQLRNLSFAVVSICLVRQRTLLSHLLWNIFADEKFMLCGVRFALQSFLYYAKILKIIFMLCHQIVILTNKRF